MKARAFLRFALLLNGLDTSREAWRLGNDMSSSGLFHLKKVPEISDWLRHPKFELL